ncbi:MAG: hypothetical protein L6R41_000825 [Letrouitia leprolyta]|nr:MAG: hypothetical protein L6R41_000825 [Letrouitia leprolyta]
MAVDMKILLFGDQTVDPRENLRGQLLSGRRNVLVSDLFQKVGTALKYEISQLSHPERDGIPSFATLEELLDRLSTTQAIHSGIASALLCVSQLAEYLEYDFEGTKILRPSLTGLDQFVLPVNTFMSITLSKRAYISAISRASVTISGPPSTLKQLSDPAYKFGTSSCPVCIGGPYHADHLHSQTKLQRFLPSPKPHFLSPLDGYKLLLPIISSSTGAPFDQDLSLLDLLPLIISDIINHPLQLEKILSRCVDFSRDISAHRCAILSFGSPLAGGSFLATMKQETTLDVSLNLPSMNSPVIRNPNEKSWRSKKPKIAIVGMAGRFPNAANHEKFWELLEAGLDVHRKVAAPLPISVPPDRFDVEKHYDPMGKKRNTSHTPFGCFIDEPGLFDPRFFNMSPREATQTDPMHRLGLTSAFEALEMAGYVPNRTPSTRLDRIGTFYGQTSDDWREINAAQDVDTYFITGGVRAFAPGRINYHFKFSGPSYSVDTACSSSMAAIQLACTALWAQECDTAVTGGLNVMTNSDIFAGLSKGQFLSKTGNCQTYDNAADGYCRGDGIGTLILKRLEDAEADNDRILGVVLETATNHSANAISITHPHAETQEVLFQKVMNDAGVDAHDVDYVEMHGTGTQAGDGTEMKSVTNVFAPSSRKGQRQKPLHLGSVKANVGHGEAVSGVTALIKCLLMLERNTIPPHCGIKKTINQGFPQDLMARNVHIALKKTPFSSDDGSPRRIFVNNFSAAGGNTAMLLEDAPPARPRKTDPRSHWVIAVSAKSKTALRANTRKLIQYIDDTEQLRIADLSYSSTARRIQHNYRIAFECSTLSEAREVLASKLDDTIDPIQGVAPTVAFVYTGQGSHYAALGKEIYETSQSFRSDLLSYDSIAAGLGFPSIIPLIHGDVAISDLSPLVVQLGLTCIQMALTRLWGRWGIIPNVVLGHSLGEYAALNAAGVISASDVIFLVGERARLLQKRCTAGSHAMLAAMTSEQVVSDLVASLHGISIACINGPGETVLSGTIADIDAASERLISHGIKSKKLNLQYAFHSSQVDVILDEFEGIAKAVDFHNAKIPIISPLLSGVVNNNVDATYLSRHARDTVNFSGSINASQQIGIIDDQTLWLEIGPHPVCSNFVKAELGSRTPTFPSLRKDTPAYKSVGNTLSAYHLAGIQIQWEEYHRDFSECLQLLDLPTYAFDNKNYWIQYTGDWNLSKGLITGPSIVSEASVSSLSTTSIHRVLSEIVDGDMATVVTESDISRPDLHAAVSGHMVNGTALCPSSLYADMAVTVGEHLHKLLCPNDERIHMNVCDMEVSKPFIAETGAPKGQMIRLSATLRLATNKADLVFSSGSGKSIVEHAKCHVEYGLGAAWLQEWERNAYLIKGRIETLKKAANAGTAHRMLRGMAYKLFASFVDYDIKYRGMEEVILDSPELEATSHVMFQTSKNDGEFVCSPYWIDSVAHLAGFIVNANDALDSSQQVYISHGWESMRFAEPLQATKTYRSYVKMQPAGPNMVSGDVYVFDDDKIIGLVEALKFQCIPRQLLNTFLPPRGLAASKVLLKADRSLPSKLTVPKPPPIKKITKPRVKNTLSKDPSNEVTTKALSIVASELGIPVEELADSIEFANLGVDSLMSLSITGRMREELEIEVQSSLFTDYPTVQGMKGFLSQYDLLDKAEELFDTTDGSQESELDSDDMSSNGGRMSTPTSLDSADESELSEISTDSGSMSMIIRETISREMGVEVKELLATDDLSSLGMDSLMSLSILGVLRETTGLSLSTTFLIDNHSIKAIEDALHISPLKKEAKPDAKIRVAQRSMTTKAERPKRLASSVLLQGRPKSASRTFWIAPDGSGSATSYVFIPEISPDTAVWALNSPFVKTPEEYHGGVIGMAASFITEMKRRQPDGPYSVGGWSAGGVMAYEIVRQLTGAGDRVDRLVLIDSPSPAMIEPLPASLHRFFGEIGLLGDGDGALERLPPWLLPHFAKTVEALGAYKPHRPTLKQRPKVFAIWCEDGVCKYPTDRRPDPYPYGHAQWLLENRSDFGPNRWDEYLDGASLTTRQMPGNHFTMMREPYVTRLGELLREALS